MAIVNTHINRLVVSGLKLLLGLLWLFIGKEVVDSLLEPANAVHAYWFISGMMLGLVFNAIFSFIREILVIFDVVTLNRDITEKVYHEILNESSVAVAIKNIKGQYIYVNDYFCEIFGVTKNYIAGKMDDCFMDEIEVMKCQQEDDWVLSEIKQHQHEEELMVGGQTRHYETVKTPLYKNKKLIGLYIIRRDISVQYSLEAKNKELDRRYKRLFDDLPFPTMMLDVKTTLAAEFNPALLDMLGYKRGEFFRTRLGLYMAEDGQEITEFINKLVEDKGGIRSIQLISKNKDVFDVEAHFKVVEIKNNTYLHAIFRDVTENKQTTNDLIRSKQNYYTLFNHANDAIFIIDPETLAIVDANELAYIWLGYGEGELNNLSIYDIDKAGLEKITREKLSELAQHKDILFEHEMCTYQGDVVAVEISAHTVVYGNKLAYQYVVRDISERKVAEWALRESEDRYWSMFENNSSIMLVIDPVRNIIEDANVAAIEFYKKNKEELVGKNFNTISLSEDDFFAEKNTHSVKPKLYESTHKIGGDVRFVEVSQAPIEIHGRELRFVIVRDITDSKEVVSQLNLAQRMFASSSESVMVLDSEQRIVSVNDAMLQMSGYDEAELSGQKPEIILADTKNFFITEKISAELEANGVWKGVVWNRRKTGESYSVNTHIELIKSLEDNKKKYVMMMTRANSRSSQQQLPDLHRDNMIGLADKDHYVDRLEYALKRSKRSGKYIAVVIIDIRRFYELNKRDGFDVGDQLLRTVGRRLQFVSRESDYVSHFGADKFAMLLEEIVDVNKINIVAQKILSTLSENYQVGDELYDLIFSIGISLFPEDGAEANDLIEKAEVALLASKLQAASNYHLYSTELNEKAKIWWDYEVQLHKALKNDQFRLFFLPQFNVNEKSLSAIEVLLRWEHPEKGLLEPAELLVEAENTGFIVAIGDWVIRQACAELSRLQKAGSTIPEIVINISALQLDENFLEFLQQVCDEESVSISQIAMDMNESAMHSLSYDQIAIIELLRKAGVKFQIDNFGKGSTPISLLLDIGFDRVKMDARLINQLAVSDKARRHCEMMHAMSEVMGFKIIAEGVEAESQLIELKKIKCEFAQGHYFSEAMDLLQLNEYLKKVPILSPDHELTE
ncbi:MAG: PAS domain S-box protein [Gammaproteobacteria bacterium]|nr:PAS domain S-box protein [Gammaproteobacteria bacterium]